MPGNYGSRPAQYFLLVLSLDQLSIEVVSFSLISPSYPIRLDSEVWYETPS